MLSKEERKLLEGVKKDPPPKSYSKPLLFFLGFLLAVIMSSYIFLAPTVQDNLVGYIQSSVILENTIQSGQTTIHISEDVKETVQGYYNTFPDVETALCLQGTHTNKTYNITSVYRPQVYSSSFTHVSHEPCSEETIILFHTHPEQSCKVSAQDQFTLQRAQETKPNTIMLIMCQPQRFNVVTQP